MALRNLKFWIYFQYIFVFFKCFIFKNRSSAERTDKPFYISKKIKKSDSKVFGSSRRDWKKRRIYEKGKESNNPKGILSGVYVYFLGFSEEPQSKIKKIINQNGGIVLYLFEIFIYFAL